jgi:large subunit ribosomal protein L15
VKLHELRPAPGSRKARTRVGRGIAAGKGKTAGRGTKGQKSRAGSGIPPWFEGGQTPIHVRVPKLRGFRSPFRIDYQVVNIGRIADYAEAGRFGVEASGSAKGGQKSKGGEPVTVNPDNMAAAGLIGSHRKPVKVLGQGDVSTKLFVVADAFTESARTKIEGAGGFVQLLNPKEEPVAEGDSDTPAAGADTKSGEPDAEAGPTDAGTESGEPDAAAGPTDAEAGAADSEAGKPDSDQPQPDSDQLNADAAGSESSQES